MFSKEIYTIFSYFYIFHIEKKKCTEAYIDMSTKVSLLSLKCPPTRPSSYWWNGGGANAITYLKKLKS